VTNAEADFAPYTGSVQAYGGGSGAGAGTVYLRLPGQGLYDGTLIVSNNVTGGQTLISSNVTDAIVNDVIVEVAAIWRLLQPGADGRRHVVECGEFHGYLNGQVIFFGGGSSTSTLFGNTEFTSLICTNAGKTLAFAAGSSNAVQALVSSR